VAQLRYQLGHSPHLAFGNMPSAITHFIPFKVLNFIETLRWFRPVANLGHGAFVPMVWMEAVIYVTPKVFVTVKPRANADEDATRKPLRAVITVRGAGIRRTS
jgi:hypothetical protein